MSLTKGDFGGFDRRRKDDGFKISLSKATFNYNLTHIFCVVLTLFLIHVAKRQEKRAFWPPHPSLLSYV